MRLFHHIYPHIHTTLCSPTGRALKTFSIFASSLLVINMLFSSVTLPPSANASSCDDLKIIFARGSGESLGDSSATAWQQELDAQLRHLDLSYSFYELGSSPQSGAQYPAVSVSDSAEGILNLIGAVVSAGNAYNFGDSVTEGVNELKAYLSALSSVCPNTKVVLGGYSQGAMVISRALPSLDPDQIVYAATFGDPKLYLPEGAGLPSAACLGRAYSSYRAYVPDCQAYFGVLGGYQPYEPAGFTGKLGTWCNQDDIMCSSGWSFSDHSAYVSENLYYDAAVKIRAAVQSAFPPTEDVVSATSSSSHDLAILIDATQTMAMYGLLYRPEAIRLADQVYERGGRVALYIYRDLIDPETAFEQLCDFSCTREEFVSAIYDIQYKYGVDVPESVLYSSLSIMNTLKWRPGVTKTIVLLTDATYLSPDRDGTTLADVVQRSLEIDPVNIYVVANKQKVADAYTELASLTGGRVYLLSERAKATTAILERPNIMLESSAYTGRVGDTFTFSVVAPDPTHSYDWDLDGDGIFETAGSASISHTYTEPFSGFIQVRATNSSGYSGTMSAHVTADDPDTFMASPTATILSAQVSAQHNRTVQVELSTQHAERLLLALDDAILGYLDPAAQTSLTLTDVEPGSTLTLIPYNAAGQRGTSRELLLIPGPAPDATPDPAPDSTSEPVFDSAPSTTLVPTSPSTFIPKAPNAGTVCP